MKTNVGEKIAEIRKRKGLTQDEVAERANVNLRTVQRIESGETDPRGYTLSSICKVLEVNIEDILDYGKTEDKSFFVYLHLSVLAGCIIPLGDIIIPLILWLTKRDKIVDLNFQAKNLLLFRACFDFVMFLFMVGSMIYVFHSGGPEEVGFRMIIIYSVFIGINFLVSLSYPVYVAISINKSDRLKSYYPRFIKG
ncbi:MAG: helix-turn-helix domain-containing protein [Prevotella sp.]|jgi:transcriptional regulator with XRE-family HTH domain|nr:helix-turn-helix domain-containing protein [Prevotella sp.]